MSPVFPLEIFYDGSCRICSAEMASYRKRNHEGRLLFIDISAPEFDPAVIGKGREELMKVLHVRDAAGQFHLGIDAFISIWESFPPGSAPRLLSVLVGFPGINLLARGGYHLFARNRHLLPRKASDCRDGSCQMS